MHAVAIWEQELAHLYLSDREDPKLDMNGNIHEEALTMFFTLCLVIY